MLHEYAFGQFQCKTGGLQARLFESCKYTFKKALLSERHRGDIYCNGCQRQTCIHPGARLPARFPKNPIADWQNKAAVFCNGNKPCRADETSNGMRPTY